MAELPQAEKDHQLSRADEFACPGLNAFTITGMVIISTAVVLRFLARKAAKLEWKADDYTLLVGLVSLYFPAMRCPLVALRAIPLPLRIELPILTNLDPHSRSPIALCEQCVQCPLLLSHPYHDKSGLRIARKGRYPFHIVRLNDDC